MEGQGTIKKITLPYNPADELVSAELRANNRFCREQADSLREVVFSVPAWENKVNPESGNNPTGGDHSLLELYLGLEGTEEKFLLPMRGVWFQTGEGENTTAQIKGCFYDSKTGELHITDILLIGPNFKAEG